MTLLFQLLYKDAVKLSKIFNRLIYEQKYDSHVLIDGSMKMAIIYNSL